MLRVHSTEPKFITIHLNFPDIEKAESKYRRAHEEYKNCVSSNSSAREDFEKKMTVASKRFQVSHLSSKIVLRPGNNLWRFASHFSKYPNSKLSTYVL